MTDLKPFRAGASGDDAVAALRPDYRALLIAVDRLRTSSSDEAVVEHPRPGEFVWCDDGRHLPPLELAPGPSYPALAEHHGRV